MLANKQLIRTSLTRGFCRRSIGNFIIPGDAAVLTELNKAAGKKIFYFTASWCPPCKKIAPIFEKLSKNHATVTFVKIDIDEFPDIAGAFRVRSVPTFFFLNGDKVTSETFMSGLETFQQLLSEGHPSPKATLQKMASTGVTVNDEVIAQFNDVKLGRVKLKFIIYKIDNGVIVTESVGLSESFDDFIAMMPADDCRYSMYDMNFTTNDGRPGNKLVFISWAPDTAKIKAKMVYAGSKDALTRALVGVSTKISATDLSELTEAIVVEACKKFA